MPSVILSDNGVSSGSAGLKSTAASDGVLVLQTTTSGGTATNAVYVDTSQNVGIGTSSPVQKQHLDGGAGDTYLQFSNSTTGATSSDGSRIGIASADTTLRIQNLESGSIRFDTAGSERMRLDASGNLLLGTTSSPTASAKMKIQTATRTAAFFDLTATGGENWIIDSTNTSGSTDVLGIYAYGASGMYLADTGNLGIGTTSPSEKLQVAGSIRITSNASNFNVLGGQLDFITDTTRLSAYNSTGGYVTFYTNSSGGNVAERARIDPSGNLLLMTTSSSITADVGIKFINGSAGNAYMGIVNSSSINGNANYHLYSTGAGAYRFYVGMGGTIYATSTSISALSDQTLKTNIRDLETGLTEVMALKPRRFDWINGDATNVAGFVAQEVEQVLPELVTDYIHNKDEEGNDITKKSLKMGDILPTLVKAIQELKAIVDAQAAEIAALKGTQP